MSIFVIQSVLEIFIAAAIITGFFFEDRLVRFERRVARKIKRHMYRRLHKNDYSFRTAHAAREGAVTGASGRRAS